MATGDTTIGEASPSDSTWGIGLSLKDPTAKDPTKWTGKNLLGKILMSVRNSRNRVWVCMCVPICVYMCIYTCLCRCAYICVYMYVYIYIYIYMCPNSVVGTVPLTAN